MIKIIKQEIEIDESLKKRMMIICDFCNTTGAIINGSFRKFDRTNNDYKTIQDLSVSLKDISTQLTESKEQIKILSESNNALELRNLNLKPENNKLKEKNIFLQEELDNVKNLLDRKI